MSAENGGTTRGCDPWTAAVAAVTFLLLVVWFVWQLVSPPGLRVNPALRAQPIPRGYGEPTPRLRSFRRYPSGVPGYPGVGSTSSLPAAPPVAPGR